jgi:hypothetical protein
MGDDLAPQDGVFRRYDTTSDADLRRALDKPPTT